MKLRHQLYTVVVSSLAVTSALAQNSAHVPSGVQVEKLQGTLGAAPSSLAPRPLNRETIALIKDFEGWSARAYNDSVGYCTIGYGHLIALKKCAQVNLGPYSQGISLEQGLRLLDQDTALARLVVQKRVSQPTSSDEFGALTSFVFNLGEQRFAGSTLFRLAIASKLQNSFVGGFALGTASPVVW